MPERDSDEVLVRRYFGGLAHVHTKLSNYPGHAESNLHVSAVVRTLIGAGLCGRPESPLGYILFNEHSSNPAAPHRLGRFNWRTRLLLHRRRRESVQGVPVMFGLEVSLLRDGHTDLTAELAARCPVVIGSRHRLPDITAEDPAAIMQMFEIACRDSVIDILGHPLRNIEALGAVDWTQVFTWAADTGTAVEVNFNSFWRLQPAARMAWRHWLWQLGASKAVVFIGEDLHTTDQLQQFVALWRALEQGRPNALTEFVHELAAAGIEPERVVNAAYAGLRQWLTQGKPAGHPPVGQQAV